MEAPDGWKGKPLPDEVPVETLDQMEATPANDWFQEMRRHARNLMGGYAFGYYRALGTDGEAEAHARLMEACAFFAAWESAQEEYWRVRRGREKAARIAADQALRAAHLARKAKAANALIKRYPGAGDPNSAAARRVRVDRKTLTPGQ